MEHANGSEAEIARRVAERTGRDEDAALADVRRLRAEAEPAPGPDITVPPSPQPAEPHPPMPDIPEAPTVPTPHEPIIEPPPAEEPLLAPMIR